MTESGYSESAVSLYEMLLNHMVNFSITEDQFSAIKDALRKKNKAKAQAESAVMEWWVFFKSILFN